MSLKINIDKIDDETREKINKDLIVTLPSKSNFIPDKELIPYDMENNYIYLPFSYAISNLGYKNKRPLRKDFPAMNSKFEKDLREEQVIIKNEATTILNKTGSVIISAYPGCGKTSMSIYLASNIKLKTLVIVNKIVLMKQWEESINKFCPTATVQRLTTKSKMKDADFYIMNAINVCKMGRNFFKDIGLLICDEVHLLVAETLSKSLMYICPRYIIGLSATPYREDGLNYLLDIYFGTNKIIRELKREHKIYKVNTGIDIPLEICESTKKVDWNAVIEEQSSNKERSKLIIKIIRYFKDRTFLILCKRKQQANYIFKSLKNCNENVDNLIGDKQEFDINCRVLVSIHQKTGTGFDWDKLDALLLATDLKAYFIQNLGRVFRRKDNIPIVFDLVDNNFILLKHFRDRKKVYDNVGGEIVDFNEEFPEF